MSEDDLNIKIHPMDNKKIVYNTFMNRIFNS